MTNWKTQIQKCMDSHGESFSDVESCTLTSEELNRQFDNGYGGAEGDPFTLWTKNRVYFPVVYDGAEWVESVPRNPNGEKTAHFGGQ